MKALLLAVAIAASQCTPEPKPVPEPDPGLSGCEAACARLMALGCHDGDPTTEGGLCVDVCENAASSPLPLPVACVARAPDCEAAAQCGSDP